MTMKTARNLETKTNLLVDESIENYNKSIRLAFWKSYL